MSYTPTPLADAIRRVLRVAVPASIKLAWADQGKTDLGGTYATLKVVDLGPLGMGTSRVEDLEGTLTETVEATSEALATVTFYGPNSHAEARRLAIAMKRSAVTEQAQAERLGFARVVPIRRSPVVSSRGCSTRPRRRATRPR